MAGGGIKPGMTYGETDDFAYNVALDPVHVHDFQATILHLLGIDHTKSTFKFQGRHCRLADVHGDVVRAVMAGASRAAMRGPETERLAHCWRACGRVCSAA